MSQIPAFDLRRAVQPLREQVLERWRALLEVTAFVGGDEVAEFERSFAGFLGSTDCVGVANGTDALVVALRALDLRPGDEVIVPSFSFIASAACVMLAGGRPVFADVEPLSLNIDPDSLEAHISQHTVGVIGVHLYGRPFDVEGVTRVCEHHGLWLIEDAAQAHGAEWKSTKVGNFGQLATWSFYPSKNLGCFGDGGAVSGNSSELLERVRRLANHGRVGHYLHSEVGTNSRLDALQAAILNCRLPSLAADNERRRVIARRYEEGLSDIDDIQFLSDSDNAKIVYHQMTILTDRRDDLRSFLVSQGIGTSVHYPQALHLQPAFQHLEVGEDELPVAGTAGDRVLCLPMFPQLTNDEVARVARAIQEFFATARTDS